MVRNIAGKWGLMSRFEVYDHTFWALEGRLVRTRIGPILWRSVLRDRHFKSAAFADIAFDAHFAVMAGQDMLHNRQAQARASHLA